MAESSWKNRPHSRIWSLASLRSFGTRLPQSAWLWSTLFKRWLTLVLPLNGRTTYSSRSCSRTYCSSSVTISAKHPPQPSRRSYGEGDLTLMNSERLQSLYALVMTPLDEPLETRNLVPRIRKGHNVDKPVLAGDVSLMGKETMLQSRIAAAYSLALLVEYDEVSFKLPCHLMRQVTAVDCLLANLRSGSAHKISFSSIIIQSWANHTTNPASSRKLAQLSEVLLAQLDSLSTAYVEVSAALSRLQGDCQNLLSTFHTEGKLSKDRIPSLPAIGAALPTEAFSLDFAQRVAGELFESLSSKLGKSGSRALPNLKDRQKKLLGSIGYFALLKERYDVEVAASVAGALVSLGVMPPKIGGLVKALMDGVRVSY